MPQNIRDTLRALIAASINEYVETHEVGAFDVLWSLQDLQDQITEELIRQSPELLFEFTHYMETKH